MNITIFRKAGMQAAMLALCTGALCTVPMMAQDTTPPPPPQGQMGRGMVDRAWGTRSRC